MPSVKNCIALGINAGCVTCDKKGERERERKIKRKRKRQGGREAGRGGEAP